MLTIAAILTIILGTVFAVRLVGRGGAAGEDDDATR